MYCKNCGNQVATDSAVCLNCGVATGAGTNFCHNCGAQTMQGAAVCTNCGVALGNAPINNVQSKSKLAAGLLGILLGSFGVHNFYLGYTKKAVTQLLLSLVGSIFTCGITAIVAGVWGLIEGIQILTGSINIDANGVPLSD